MYALIHNAGGGSVAPTELMDLDKFRLEAPLQTMVDAITAKRFATS